MTATPERADGLDVLRYFDGRIAAELRVWDAIDQQYLVPVLVLRRARRNRPERRPVEARHRVRPERATNVLTADHVWARPVVEQVRLKTSDPHAIRALGFCVTSRTPASWPSSSARSGSRRVAIWGDSPMESERPRSAISTPAGSTSCSPSTCSTRASTSRRRHAAAAAPNREPDPVPAAARPRLATRTRQGALHRPRLRRQPPPRVPLRSTLPGAARRQPA